MAYDLKLETRSDKTVTEVLFNGKKKTFRGICYRINGTGSPGIYGDFLIVRTSPDRAAGLADDDTIKASDITGCPVKGRVAVSPAARTDGQTIHDLLKTGIDAATSLPSK